MSRCGGVSSKSPTALRLRLQLKLHFDQSKCSHRGDLREVLREAVEVGRRELQDTDAPGAGHDGQMDHLRPTWRTTS